MGNLASAAFATTLVAAALLIFFGLLQTRRPADRRRGVLMIICGLIFVGNVLIWTV